MLGECARCWDSPCTCGYGLAPNIKKAVIDLRLAAKLLAEELSEKNRVGVEKAIKNLDKAASGLREKR